jgi:hypothetical protein
MASAFPIKSRAFTLGEAVIASFVFLIALGIISQIVITITKTSFQINEFNNALDNLRLGMEKIWRELKYGSDFSFSASTIGFNDRNCRPSSLDFVNNNLVLKKDNDTTNIFDPSLIKVNSVNFSFDNPAGGGGFYFETAPKIIIISMDLEIKSKTGSLNLKIEEASAPLNSLLPKSPCE